jgi:hypothetical protein
MAKRSGIELSNEEELEALLNPKVLYHGTTLSRARKICVEGFVAVSPSEEIFRLSNAYGVDSEVVVASMEEWGRFSVLPGRESVFYSTVGFDHAASYAQRAPEVRWETLCSIYRLRHPELGDFWNDSDELHWWVFLQLMDDPPAVVTLSLPEVKKLGGGPMDSSFELPLPASLVLDVDEIPRTLDESLTRFVAGYGASEGDVTKFSNEVEAGKWGTVHTGRRGEFLWCWDELKKLLSRERLEELTRISL